VQCWGNDSLGELGDGTTTTRSTPAAVLDLNNPRAVTCGVLRTCAILNAGEVSCWGAVADLPMCDGTFPKAVVPHTLPGILNVRSIAVGQLYTCVVMDDGTAQCWGASIETPASPARCDQPTKVSNLSNAETIVFSGNFACAVTWDGNLKCWESPDAPAEEILGFSNVQAVSSGLDHSCALLDSGSIKCWGSNIFGELGDGTTTDHYDPADAVTVKDISDAAAVAAGWTHTCALLRGGSAKCWGGNWNGQLGDGTTTDSHVPVTVAPW
jgi:alpha-tubulin suppressor-like RCC1 family protein